MSEIAPTLEQVTDTEVGEFPLPHVDPDDAADPQDERDRYDEQILAALVSP
jgi:hypothetical protein